MNKLLILTEAGVGIGLGHYTRCSAINNAAIDLDIDCIMAVNWIGEQLSSGENITLNWADDLEMTAKRFCDYDTVIIDSYELSENGYRFLKSYFDKLVVIDDYNRISYPAADLLINPNVYFETINYDNQQAICYGGEKYIILREVFRNANISFPTENIKKVLITLGGSDFQNLLPIICKALSNNMRLDITVICPEKEQRKELESLSSNVVILGMLNPKEIFSLYQDNDVIVSGCGQTLHELASLRKPVIGICVGEDQILNQSFYFEKKFLTKKINWKQSNLLDTVVVAMNEFRNLETRREVFSASENIFNRDGVFNIIHLLNS